MTEVRAILRAIARVHLSHGPHTAPTLYAYDQHTEKLLYCFVHTSHCACAISRHDQPRIFGRDFTSYVPAKKIVRIE